MSSSFVDSVAMSAQASPSVSPRAPRGVNDVLSVSDLFASLSVLAKNRDCTVDWQLSTYVKTRRSQGPDKEGLVTHGQLLAIVLSHAPGGRPGQVALQDTWMALHRRYGIGPTVNPEVWADKCAVKIRLALKHLLDIKASPPKSIPPEICMLLDKVVDTNGGSSPAGPHGSGAEGGGVGSGRYSPSTDSIPAAQPSPTSPPAPDAAARSPSKKKNAAFCARRRPRHPCSWSTGSATALYAPRRLS